MSATTTPAELTLEELAAVFGPVPTVRARQHPAPGTATEDEVASR